MLGIPLYISEPGSKSVHLRQAGSPGPHRRQWEKNVPGTALTALENASILTSSVTAEDDKGEYSRPIASLGGWFQDPLKITKSEDGSSPLYQI